MSHFRCTLALAALATCWTTVAVVARPADSGEQLDDEFAEPDPTVLMTVVPANVFANPESAFGRVLRDRLAVMSERDLSALQKGLPTAADVRPVADEEMMMGDMPASDEPDTPCPTLAGTELPDLINTPEVRRQRDRESTDSTEMEKRFDELEEPNRKLRIQTIQNQIIQFVGWNVRAPTSPNPLTKPRPSSSIPTTITAAQQKDAIRILYENVNNFPSFPSDSYTEKTQSFYPICDLPKNTSEDAWNSRAMMNLMFNITLPKAANGISVNVSMAKLRLFKQLVFCNSQTSNETDDSNNCQPILLEDTIKQSNFANISSSAEIPLIMEDKQIRVSIYMYTRSLKRKRVRRKLVDSRMLPYYGERWTEWNIRSAVKTWRKDPFRNYGLSIEVEDEDGNLLPVSRFFKPMNCTGDAQFTTPKPIPGFLMEAVHHGISLSSAEANPNMSSLQALSFNMYRYPMVDVTTIEVPESEVHSAMLYQYAKYAFDQNLASKLSQTGPVVRPDPDQTELHRIRHGNRHHINSTEVDGLKISKDGHEFRDQIIVQGIVHRNTKSVESSTESSY